MVGKIKKSVFIINTFTQHHNFLESKTKFNKINKIIYLRKAIVAIGQTHFFRLPETVNA